MNENNEKTINTFENQNSNFKFLSNLYILKYLIKKNLKISYI